RSRRTTSAGRRSSSPRFVVAPRRLRPAWWLGPVLNDLQEGTSMSPTGWITHRPTRWIVRLVALGIAVGLALFAGQLSSAQDNELANWLPGDAESTDVITRIADIVPDDEAVVLLRVPHHRRDVPALLREPEG